MSSRSRTELYNLAPVFLGPAGLEAFRIFFFSSSVSTWGATVICANLLCYGIFCPAFSFASGTPQALRVDNDLRRGVVRHPTATADF
jgi:hypothetical protein